jgi:hypothetical protein
MGARLGYDLRGVRVHDGPEASELNRLLAARAFTIGPDIFFGPGAYDPDSAPGRELIAHELIHVVQQGGGGVMGHEGAMIVRPAGDLFEQEADAMAGPIAGLERPSSSHSPRRRIGSTGPAQIQRALGQEALSQLPRNVPGLTAVTCHVATWYWAAQEAMYLGLTGIKPAADTLQNMVNMSGGPQNAMLALSRSGTWDFTRVATLPPVGTVLLWTAPPTHSAVVTSTGMIAGYNQQCVFPTIGGNSLTFGTPAQLGPGSKQPFTISEATIVQAAGRANL